MPSSMQSDLVVVWLDENFTADVNDSESYDARLDLGCSDACLKLFSDMSHCHDFLSSFDPLGKILFIVSEALGEITLSQLHDHSQIVCFYVFCIDQMKRIEWAGKFSKVRNVYTSRPELIDRLQRDIQFLIHHLTPISIFNMTGLREYSLQNIDRDQANYMWFQLLIEILLRLPPAATAKRDMIEDCLKVYQDDPVEMRKIDEFDQNYTADSAIQWYTRDCFIYRLVNRVFRMRNIKHIFKYRFFIRDLFHQLERVRGEQGKRPETVYRGQIILAQELAILKDNVGGIFSCNTFFSTTTDCQVALDFNAGAFGKPYFETVFFEIDIPIECDILKPFADVKEHSYNHDEDEVLFAVGNNFRIDFIEPLTETVWHIKLTLIGDQMPSLGKFLLKDRMNESTSLFTLGNFLEEMGDCDKAQEFYELVLAELPAEDVNSKAFAYIRLGELFCERSEYDTAIVMCNQAQDLMNSRQNAPPAVIGSIFNLFGLIYSGKGCPKKALKCYKLCLIYDKLVLPPEPQQIAIALNNIGSVYLDLGNYEQTLHYCENEALPMQLQHLPENHPALIGTYTNIGHAYSENGNYSKALEVLRKLLQLQTNILTPYHRSLMTTYTNLGVTNYYLADYDAAIQYYNRALEVLLQSCALHDLEYISLYNDIGAVYAEKGEHDEALKYYEKALESARLAKASGSAEEAGVQNNIGRSLLEKGQPHRALTKFCITLKLELRILGRYHISLATTYDNFGRVYEMLHKPKLALHFYRKALAIRLRTVGKYHSSVATSYDLIGKMHFKYGFFLCAIKFHKKALRIQFKSFPFSRHPSVVSTYQHLGAVYEFMGRFIQSLKCYRQALVTARKSLPNTHPVVIDCEMKLAKINTKLIAC